MRRRSLINHLNNFDDHPLVKCSFNNTLMRRTQQDKFIKIAFCDYMTHSDKITGVFI